MKEILGVCQIILILIILLTVTSLYIIRRQLKFSRKENGYRFYPFIGNGMHFLGMNVFPALRKLISEYKLPCNLWLGHDYNYVTADPGEIKIVMTDPRTFDKMNIYENFNLLFGNSLLSAPVDIWKRNRKCYSKSFSQPILNSFVKFFYNKSCSLVDALAKIGDEDRFAVFERFALDGFCSTVIGVDFKIQENADCPLMEYAKELQEIIGRRIMSSYYCPFLIWSNFLEGRRARKLLNAIEAEIHDIIVQKRKAHKENKDFLENDRMLPLMDAMLLSEGEKYSEREIFQEIILFCLAAMDTSGISLAFTFMLLGMNPEIQEKVYQEVMSVVGSDRPIYHDDLPNLKYTERAIQEAMRILPVTPFLGRRATSDTDLGTKTLPKDSNIFMSVFDLHRNEKYWPDPLKFDPNRFLPEEVGKREAFTYVPFSGGPRNCIGKTYAMMLMKTGVANVIRNYRVVSKYKSVVELELISCVTMVTEHPLDCNFIRRKHE